MSYRTSITDLIGKVFHTIERQEDDTIRFLNNTDEYRMTHEQDCCESVYIEDITGDLTDLVNTPILVAEERTNIDEPGPLDERDESYTWTFYEIRTIRGSVTIRWYGTSNGYYSEGVDILDMHRDYNGNLYPQYRTP